MGKWKKIRVYKYRTQAKTKQKRLKRQRTKITRIGRKGAREFVLWQWEK